MTRRFAQVDAFSAQPGGGNPGAVVLDAEGLDTEAMQRFATGRTCPIRRSCCRPPRRTPTGVGGHATVVVAGTVAI